MSFGSAGQFELKVDIIVLITDDPNAAEVVKISDGQLFLIREETIRSDRECMYVYALLTRITNVHVYVRFYRYNEAMATIRRVPSLDHHFQLVVTRVYEEGDQELLEDEDESTCIVT